MKKRRIVTVAYFIVSTILVCSLYYILRPVEVAYRGNPPIMDLYVTRVEGTAECTPERFSSEWIVAECRILPEKIEIVKQSFTPEDLSSAPDFVMRMEPDGSFSAITENQDSEQVLEIGREVLEAIESYRFYAIYPFGFEGLQDINW